MNTSRVLLFAAATLTALPLLTADALACSLPYEDPALTFITRGEVAQSAQIVVEFTGDGGDQPIVIEDASGAQLPLTQVGTPAYFVMDSWLNGRRVVYEPDAALAPGVYTLKVDGDVPDWVDPSDYETEVELTVTSDLPPEGTPTAPTLSWRALMHDGPEDPELGVTQYDSCGWSDTDSSTATIWFDAQVPAQGAPGYIEVVFEDASGAEAGRFSSAATDGPRIETSSKRYEDSAFVQCVTATFTDIYGRTSEPTRSCKPDQCVARHRNDRDPVDWADVTGCEDWSPGYAERNAPGCACAQAPGAPSGSPVALALGLMGLVALRRRF